MGTAKRFASINPTQGTPGAIYDPPFAMNKDYPPKWSFGKAPSKKKQGRDIELKMGSPPNLGPNSYFKGGYPDEIMRESSPKFQVPKALRTTSWGSKENVNETYEV